MAGETMGRRAEMNRPDYMTATWEDLMAYCTPGNPEYDYEFHCAIFAKQPQWFGEEADMESGYHLPRPIILN